GGGAGLGQELGHAAYRRRGCAPANHSNLCTLTGRPGGVDRRRRRGGRGGGGGAGGAPGARAPGGGGGGGGRGRGAAPAAGGAREPMPSLAYTPDRCAWTVQMLRCSRAATCLLDRPAAASAATFCPQGEAAAGRVAAAGAPGPPERVSCVARYGRLRGWEAFP